MARPGPSRPPARAARRLERARLGAVDHGRARHRHRRAVPDAGGRPPSSAASSSTRSPTQVERAHYPAEPPGRALPFLPRADRGHQDRAAGAARLSRARCRSCCSPASASSSCSSPTPICSAANISSSPRCAFVPPRRPRRLRKRQRALRLPRRHVDRGVRVDPDRQSGDAAVRHGVHGAHAQAHDRDAARADRTARARLFARRSMMRLALPAERSTPPGLTVSHRRR